MIKSLLLSSAVAVAVSGAMASAQPAGSDPARDPAGGQRDPSQRDPAQRDPAQRDPAQRDPAQRDPNAPVRPGDSRPDHHGADWPTHDNNAGDNAMAGEQWNRIKSDPAKIADRMFVLHASAVNTCEVDLARKAMQKTQDPEIRRLSQTLIDDHQKANESLQAAARELDVQLVRNVPADKRMEAEALLALPEDQFNKAYLSHLKAGHAASVSLYGDKATMTQNEALKQYVNQTLPHIKHHNQMITAAASAAGLPAYAGSDAGEIDRR